MFKVLITEPIAQAGIDILNEQPDIEVHYNPELFRNYEKILEIIPEYDALITRSGTPVKKELLDRAKKLKVVGRAGTGVDNIDIEECSKRGILVVNAAGGNAIAATELTLGMMIATIRKIPQAHKSLKEERKWERKKFMGIELAGKTLGIIGFGRIGSRVGVRAKAFEMNVITYDPYIPREKAEKLGVEYVENLEDLLKRADIITVHTPLTEETKGMIGEKEISLMKDGVIILNIARGGIIDEQALAKALKSGKVRAAAVDVYSKEPPFNPDNPLLDAPNVVLTPHIGANTYEAQTNVAVIVAKQVIAALRGEPVEFAVNAPVEDLSVLKSYAPYVKLAEQLGKFLIQIQPGEEYILKLKGNFSGAEKLLETAFLKGLLEKTLDIPVSIVNSRYLAQERGIKVKIEKEKISSSYENIIEAISKAGDHIFSIAGTVVENKYPKIIQIGQFKFNLDPKGKFLIFKNIDVPGVIGKVGTILGKHNINIAGFQLGRVGKGKEAKAVLIVDDDINEDALNELKNLKEITYVKFVKI